MKKICSRKEERKERSEGGRAEGRKEEEERKKGALYARNNKRNVTHYKNEEIKDMTIDFIEYNN